MSPATLSPAEDPRDALCRVMIPLHDSWMTDAVRYLAPMTHRDTTFWDRWAGVNYLADQFPERLRLDARFLSDLTPGLAPELSERLVQQLEGLTQLGDWLMRLSRRRVPATAWAWAVNDLLQALRLWYINFDLASAGTGENRATRRSERLPRLHGRRVCSMGTA
jgi:hypothetical protein